MTYNEDDFKVFHPDYESTILGKIYNSFLVINNKIDKLFQYNKIKLVPFGEFLPMQEIFENYDETIFIEEAIHRLVEIHYHIGLEKEAEKYAKILGYNYNSSEWFQQSYKIFNQEYDIKKEMSKIEDLKKDKTLFKKIIEMIK